MDGSSSALSPAITAKSRRNAEIVRLRLAGLEPRQIVKRLKLSRNVVAGVLKRAGLVDQSAKRGGWNNPMPDHVKARAVALARAFNRNHASVVAGVSYAAVTKWLSASDGSAEGVAAQVPERRSREAN